MRSLYFAVLLFLFPPTTQVLTVKQASRALSVSVLLRAKQYTVDDGFKIRHGMSGCSGTFVAGNKVLTAAHCFSRPTTDIWIRGTDKISFRAVLSKLDPEHDLALVEVKGVTNHPFSKVAEKVIVGEQVVNVGSPFDFEFLISEGVVAATGYMSKPLKSRYVIHTGMINPGSSGGGAFNARGQLIGVNTMSVGLFGWSGISLAVSAGDIKEFLAGVGQ